MEVRTKWEHEALNFTPWLAKNLDLLGDTLGMKLEEAQTEVPVGPYFLDILARDADKDVLYHFRLLRPDSELEGLAWSV